LTKKTILIRCTFGDLESFTSFEEEMGELERITLRDYGKLDHIDKVVQGFKPVNSVLFDNKQL